MIDSANDLQDLASVRQQKSKLAAHPVKARAQRASGLLQVTNLFPFRGLRPLVLGPMILALPALGQDAIVTFYSVGSLLKADAKQAVTAKGKMPFVGWIFDGDHRLAYLQGARFMTLQLPAGQHTFAGGLHSKHVAKNSSLVMRLEPGQHYCIRLGLEYENFVLVETHKGTLDPVDCVPAKAEARDSRPLDLKSVEERARNLLVSSTSSF
jgi:hypothetical protein